LSSVVVASPDFKVSFDPQVLYYVAYAF
jgi:hypothetical protein